MVSSVPKWYDARKEAGMIELTEQQVEALKHAEATPPRVVNPRTKETFVLLRVDEYKRLKEAEYDDSPWTREELQALAWEVAEWTAGRSMTMPRRTHEPGRCNPGPFPPTRRGCAGRSDPRWLCSQTLTRVASA